MQIGDKDIWQFGDQYIDSNTGNLATPEEISIFNNYFGTTEERGEAAVQWEKDRQEEDKMWHLKYDPIMQKFWGWDDEDLSSYAKGMNDEHLTYSLATSIFDNQGIVSNKMKQAFPDHWEEALKWYKNGYHDT